jgi:hypothetical protein
MGVTADPGVTHECLQGSILPRRLRADFDGHGFAYATLICCQREDSWRSMLMSFSLTGETLPGWECFQGGHFASLHLRQ